MNPETNPPQAEDVAQAIAGMLVGDEPVSDPWWQAGIDESLGRRSDGGAAPA